MANDKQQGGIGTTKRGNGDGGVMALSPNPLLHQRAKEMQDYGSVAPYPLGLGRDVCEAMTEMLNPLLADTIVLRDLYKKHHWQLAGPTFYSLHLLFDKHYNEQADLVDAIAERVQALGGIAIAMPHDVAETTRIERPPRGREEVPVQLSRLLEAHEHLLQQLRPCARRATEVGDEGTNDLLVSQVLRTNEQQVWFLSTHLVEMPLVQAR